MKKLKFKPRSTFTNDLKRLTILDRSLITEVRQAVEILLEDHQLPEEFRNHQLGRKLAGYYEFHLRDTPKGKVPNEINDVIVIYTIDDDELILIGVRIGSHKRLFGDQNSSKRYKKNKNN